MPKSVSSGPLARDAVQDVRALELRKQAVDVGDLDPAARGPGQERLGARADRPLGEVGAPAPALVRRAPEMHDGVVADHHREVLGLVHRFQAEALAVVRDRRRHVADRKGGDRAVQARPRAAT